MARFQISIPTDDALAAIDEAINSGAFAPPDGMQCWLTDVPNGPRLMVRIDGRWQRADACVPPDLAVHLFQSPQI